MSENIAAPAAQAPAQPVQAAPIVEESAAIESNEELEVPVQEESAKAAAARIKKIKMSGKEREFNLDDEKSIEELIKLAQLGDGAHTKMQKASEVEKKMAQIEKLIKEAPEQLLREYGHDVDKLAEDLIARYIEEQQKSPEQKEREMMQKEMETLRKQVEEEKKRAEEIKFQKLQAEQIQRFDEEISNAFEKYPDLPKEAYTVKRIAETLMWAYDNGFPEATVEDIMPVVENEIKSELQRLFNALPDDAVEKFLGSQVTEKMRKARLKKRTTKIENAESIKASSAKPEQEDKKPAQTMLTRDFFKKLGK